MFREIKNFLVNNEVQELSVSLVLVVLVLGTFTKDIQKAAPWLTFVDDMG